MKKFITIVFLLGVCLAAVVTCPDKEQHHRVLKSAMNTAMHDVLKDQVGADDSLFGFGLATIGTTLASKLLENMMESTLVVHDYILFSTGEVTVSGKTRTVSIGAFGHVIPTFDSEDIQKAIEG